MITSRKWGVWAACSFVSFVAMETRALVKDETTLTQATRKVMGCDPIKPYRNVTSSLLTGFFVWLTGHFVLGWGPKRRRKILE